MLTPLTIEQQVHNKSVKDYISELINTSGPLSFAQFMNEALYAPGKGYYVTGNQKIGIGGDFTTAPMISPLFSICLANQCDQVLTMLGGGDIFELGAGTGEMARVILSTLAARNKLPERYLILEPSPELRSRQQRYLLQNLTDEITQRITWISDWPESENFCGVILANEVVDAMPVERVIWDGKQWWQQTVGLDGEDNFVFGRVAISDSRLQNAVDLIEMPLPADYMTEVNLWAAPWITSMAKCMQKGLALIIDYGFARETYYHRQRDMGTLMCHFQHSAHDDPLKNVGLQDITAHVDFTSLGEAAIAQGLDVVGFCNQAEFLINCGLTNELCAIKDRQQYEKLIPGIKQLTLPQEMGELFKVIGFSKRIHEGLIGFS